ncbi:uncharacterized protein LOC121854955 isoform X2 [Homarus americanus]|nr:uncharacterized protein LOC121854955 isoform X2 [Homarus americanus]
MPGEEKLAGRTKLVARDGCVVVVGDANGGTPSDRGQSFSKLKESSNAFKLSHHGGRLRTILSSTTALLSDQQNSVILSPKSTENKTEGTHEDKMHLPGDGSDSGEILFMGVTKKLSFLFNPVQQQIKKALCKILGVTCEGNKLEKHVVPCELGIPKKIKPIGEKGDCFFRAVSYVVSGTEENQSIVRAAVVRFMHTNQKLVQPMLRPNYNSVEEYLELSCMGTDGTWATEVEIFATALLLHTDIFTFRSEKWLKFSGDQRRQNKEAIYLVNFKDAHFEVVISVSGKNHDFIVKDVQKLTKELNSVREQFGEGASPLLEKYLKDQQERNIESKTCKRDLVKDKSPTKREHIWRDKYKRRHLESTIRVEEMREKQRRKTERERGGEWRYHHKSKRKL